jgi:hypothetical protein
MNGVHLTQDHLLTLLQRLTPTRYCLAGTGTQRQISVIITSTGIQQKGL